MRRWNGWGDDSVNYPLPISAIAFLERQVGIAPHSKDNSMQEVVNGVPKSRLRKQLSQISSDPLVRLQHARGQSFTDWVDLRIGRIDSFPDGVAFPMSEEDVGELIQYARKSGCHIIPYGGGTSVVGHIDVIKGKAPVLSIDMRRMNRLIDLDQRSLMANFNAGVSGPDLEAQLRAHGFTLGHYPQ
jgi:alkyldihydroxyacetonephosphate synthase